MPVSFMIPRLVILLFALLMAAQVAPASYVSFESGPVRPLALSPDGTRLFATNTPDGQLEIFDIRDEGLIHRQSVPVGLEPVAVAARSDGEVWVVNHLSDSVSIVDVRSDPARVVRTLLVGDEPSDIVFAGTAGRAFVTAAHRGQNAPFDPALTTGGIGRGDVWVFDSQHPGSSPGGEPIAIINLFCDSPRALAVSPDGETVYAAAFRSGNRTTTVSQEAVCDGGAAAPACTIEDRLMPGGLPAPNENLEGIRGPEVGLIVRRNAVGAWLDELGRDWSPALRIDLPDSDVFAIDADTAVVRSTHAGVGTVLYGMAVDPVTGAVYVANTEARNEVRFEPIVRGHQHESRVTVIAGAAVVSHPLNPHLSYSLASGADDRRLTLALPVAIAADAERLYVAALGSDKVAIVDPTELTAGTYDPDAGDRIVVSGGGPSGLVVDSRRGRLYVATLFDDGISSIDLAARREVDHVVLHSPEPAPIVLGRRFFYDASFSSDNGEAACASCHVYGDVDGLAWDLGDPEAPVVVNPLSPRQTIPPSYNRFHPLKGPMTTQTLRGIADSGAMHWRGDRNGAGDPGGDGFDARQAFLKFAVAFQGLLGRTEAIDEAQMQALADFSLAIHQPPNPVRAFNNQLNEAQQKAADIFFVRDQCTKCHKLDPAQRQFGTDGFVAINPNPGSLQVMKIPSLRNLYQKVGMFGIFPVPVLFPPDYPRGFVGDQVRGFGFINDGAGALPPETGEFLLVFDTDFAPIVGQQITVPPTSSVELREAAQLRVALLRERAAANECDLVVQGVVDGEARGWLLAGDAYLSDRSAEAAVEQEDLDRLVDRGVALTYTCLPPDTGVRSALDRDEDGYWNGDERSSGSDPADRGSYPGGPTPTPTATATPTMPPPTPTPLPCLGDCDRSGAVTVDEIVLGVNIALGERPLSACAPFDSGDDQAVTVDELLVGIGNALEGCGSAAPRGFHVGECAAYASLRGPVAAGR